MKCIYGVTWCYNLLKQTSVTEIRP